MPHDDTCVMLALSALHLYLYEDEDRSVDP